MIRYCLIWRSRNPNSTRLTDRCLVQQKKTKTKMVKTPLFACLKRTEPNPCLTTESKTPIKSPAGVLARLILQPHCWFILFTSSVKLCSAARVLLQPVSVFSLQGCCLCCFWESGSVLCSSFHFSLCFCVNRDQLHQPPKINPRLRSEFFVTLQFSLFLCLFLLNKDVPNISFF